jgi:hypothetical protein
MLLLPEQAALFWPWKYKAIPEALESKLLFSGYMERFGKTYPN